MNFIVSAIAKCIISSVRLLVWFYYTTIRVSGRDRIPTTGPVLFVANHANSLFDPVVLGLTTRRRTRFLGKGPLFEIPAAGRLLKTLGMIPVFRSQDDRKQVKRNFESLAKAAGALVNGDAVGIFPEGKSHDNRTLETIFAGTSRIILQALEAGADDLLIVPVGINYDDKRLFRSSVWVQVGEPIIAKTLVDAAGSAAKAKRQLSDEIAASLKKVIIHLDDPQWEPFLEDLEILDSALETPDGHAVFSLRQRKTVADSLNHFWKMNPEQVADIGQTLIAHRAHLGDYGLRVRSEILRFNGPRRLLSLLWKSVRLCFGLMPVVAGTLQNAIPFFIERGIVKLLPTSNQSTIALSRVTVGVPVFLLWYGLVWWVMSHYFLPWVTWFWVIATPFSGIFSLRFWRTLQSVVLAWWAEIRMLFSRKALVDLRATQEDLRSRIQCLSDAYSHLRPSIEPKRLTLYQNPMLRRAAIFTVLAAGLGILVTAGVRVGFRNNVLPALSAPAFDFATLNTNALDAILVEDETGLSGVLIGLQDLETNARRLRTEFEQGTRSYSNDKDTDAVRHLVVSYQNCRNELLRYISKYRDTRSIDASRHQLRASLLGLTAGSALYQFSHKFITMFDRDPEARKLLNEAEPYWQIEAGLYDKISRNLQNATNLDALSKVMAWYQSCAQSDAFSKAYLQNTIPHKTFHELIAQTGKIERVGNALKAWLKEVSAVGKEVIYDGQALMSTWVGNTRVRQRKPKVSEKQLESMRDILKPGDILIERQDWYLSRAVMPGYWAHVALYVGDAEDLADLGLQDDETVAKYWDAFQHSNADGHVLNILEAVPQGVRPTTLEHCIGIADSAAILRPSGLSKTQIKDAIVRAFRHLGKPYDFEFDFDSSDKLVCSELVFRAFSGIPELEFPLVDVMGRRTLPPTLIAQKFADEYQLPECQLQLILFLDGHSKGDTARLGSPSDFAESATRPGLTWLNQ
ncbi:MAG: glycerol-3-phosphate O-acyltransferase/dihydroxyacetone phosphate acyltransferase [Verrucomicrobiales bacterium]|jgi:glycerol-3-phosphate O-acyltransferase/dihydroxyacetone phosphate acyltransferase